MYLSEFTNQYSLSKTLRFKLVPQGHTLDNMKRDMILSSDQKRADEYGEVKKLIDRYHKAYIERKLGTFSFPDVTLDHCAALYYSKDMDNLEDAQRKMMQSISDWLRCAVKNKPGEEFKALFSDQMVKSILPAFLEDEGEKQLVSDFAGFWTYFTGFCQNRENMYTGEGKETEIAYRIVKQNLPKFLDNLKVWERVRTMLPAADIAAVDADMEGLIGMTSGTIFSVSTFNHFLTQTGIYKYNQYIGCLNQIINQQSQQRNERLPHFRPLFKQILSDRDSISFIPEKFENGNQMLKVVQEYHEIIMPAINKLHILFQEMSRYDHNHIYVVGSKALSAISNYVYGSWSKVLIGLERIYEQEHPLPGGKFTEKYKKDEKKYTDSAKSLREIDQAAHRIESDEDIVPLTDGLMAKEQQLFDTVGTTYQAAKGLLEPENDYPADKLFAKDDANIKLLKDYLDSIKEYLHFVGLFEGKRKKTDEDKSFKDSVLPDKDSVFYGAYEEQIDILSGFNHLYDMVRNYATRKPFKTDKIRMMFDCSSFLNGWDVNKETTNLGCILTKDNAYYVAVLRDRHCLEKIPCSESNESSYQKMVYKQIPNASKYFSKKQILPQNPPQDIKDILKKKGDKEAGPLTRDEVTRFIDYIQNEFIPNYSCLHDEEGRPYFHFSFKKPDDYVSVNDFFNDVDSQSYVIGYKRISAALIDELVDNGKIYLFMIYSKDFSPYSHGTPNLHTLYFKALFDESTAGRVRLQGGAQIYYRAPSLKLAETTVHPANSPVNNKNPLNPKPQSTFDYDMVKDKRYTCDHFELHIPVSLNAAAAGYVRLNDAVRTSLVQADEQYVIGIDRGERNLLYVSVIDSYARIVEQFSLNVIEDSFGGSSMRTDYHDLLTKRGIDRQEARREWKTIEGIKELKEGYLSQAVHRICCLVEKYGAIVVMENLNAGFKNTRSAVEKSVYQKFEKMLCDKLSFMVNKQKQPTECGGVLNAYQLAEPTTSYTDMRGQNGIIFYVPAWLTSKIDPTTGFADMLRPRYESVESAKDFFGRFDSVTYNTKDNLFEFAADLTAFPKTDADHRKKWVICTNGERIRTFRNEAKNNQWDNDIVRLTDEMIRLFDDYGIDYKSGDLRPAILRQTEKAFFTRLIGLLKLTLQMRNSITGTDVDYMVSPVRNASGTFYDSRLSDERLPKDADANGAYNIARKGLWVVEQIKQAADVTKVNLAMTNAQWLEYAQTHFAGEEAE